MKTFFQLIPRFDHRWKQGRDFIAYGNHLHETNEIHITTPLSSNASTLPQPPIT
jgi:hypothetical protein